MVCNTTKTSVNSSATTFRPTLLSTKISNFSTFFFFFNDTATTEIYTLSLHDALPIYARLARRSGSAPQAASESRSRRTSSSSRSEEHTSELQSRQYLVCRLLLEKKKKKVYSYFNHKKKKT